MSDEKFKDLNIPRAEKMAHTISNTIAASIRSNKASDDAVIEVLNIVDTAISDLWPDEAEAPSADAAADDEEQQPHVDEDQGFSDTETKRLPPEVIPTDPLAVSHYIHMLDDASFMAATAAVMARLTDMGLELRDKAEA